MKNESHRGEIYVAFGGFCLGILILLAIPIWAFADIAYDTSGKSSQDVADPDISSFNNAGDIIVCSAWSDATVERFTGITFNGSSFTKQDTTSNVSGMGILSSWYLMSPTVGTYTINATLSSGLGSLACASYTGVDTAAIDTNTVKNQDGTSSFSQTATTTADNAWIVFGAINSAASHTAGTGTTLRQGSGTGSTYVAIGDTNGALTPAGNHSMTMTTSGSQNWGGVMIGLVPSAGGGGGGSSTSTLATSTAEEIQATTLLYFTTWVVFIGTLLTSLWLFLLLA